MIPHTRTQPRAVVVHLRHADLANTAVVGALRLPIPALCAEGLTRCLVLACCGQLGDDFGAAAGGRVVRD